MIWALDDNKTILAYLEEALEPLPVLTSTQWTDISKSMMKFAGEEPDEPLVLICDLQMPGMDGMNFCRLMKRYVPQVKILVFSGQSVPAHVEDIADAFLPKDVDPADLKMAIEVLHQ